MSAPLRAVRVALIAGEHSGDQLGFKLMRALRAQTGGEIEFFGVGGEAMEAEGLKSLFPIGEIAVMGVLPVVAKLPILLKRIRQSAEAVVAGRPDALVIIDSPDFTHRVARRVRRVLPDLPVIDYVSPSVWAWRPGRARAMRGYVDCVLALLPFEPDEHARIGGPRCVYVGHPLIERLSELRPDAAAARRRAAEPPLVVALPGSSTISAPRWRLWPASPVRSKSSCRPCRTWRAKCARAPRGGRSSRASKSARPPSSRPFAPPMPRSPPRGR